MDTTKLMLQDAKDIAKRTLKVYKKSVTMGNYIQSMKDVITKRRKEAGNMLKKMIDDKDDSSSSNKNEPSSTDSSYDEPLQFTTKQMKTLRRMKATSDSSKEESS